MNIVARTAGLTLVATCVAILPLGAPPVDGQTPPERLTTDSPEYCLHLLEHLQQVVRQRDRPPPSEVTYLSGEGELMCDRGETRGGILRLRRAIHIMMAPEPSR